MTDLTLTPETAAAAAWRRAELALRLQWTRSRLMALSQLAGILTASDRVDAGRGIWTEYIDDRIAANPHAHRTAAEISEQASVLADVARHVEQADVVAYAAAAWGSAEVEVHASDAVHVTWTPWTRIVLITRVISDLVDVVETYAEPLDAHATGVPSA